MVSDLCEILWWVFHVLLYLSLQDANGLLSTTAAATVLLCSATAATTMPGTSTMPMREEASMRTEGKECRNGRRDGGRKEKNRAIITFDA